MVATVRLDERHEQLLNEVADKLHKKKSEILREALDYYAQHILDAKRRRIRESALRIRNAERNEMDIWEETIDDGLKR